MSKKYDYVNRYKNTVNYIVYDGRCDPDWNTELMISDCNDDLRCGSFQGFYELYRAIDYGRIIMVVHNEGTTLVDKETYDTITIVDRIDDSIVYAVIYLEMLPGTLTNDCVRPPRMLRIVLLLRTEYCMTMNVIKNELRQMLIIC